MRLSAVATLKCIETQLKAHYKLLLCSASLINCSALLLKVRYKSPVCSAVLLKRSAILLKVHYKLMEFTVVLIENECTSRVLQKPLFENHVKNAKNIKNCNKENQLLFKVLLPLYDQ